MRQNSSLREKPSSKPHLWRVLIAAVAVAVTTLATRLDSLSGFWSAAPSRTSPNPIARAPTAATVTALGRLEPHGEVIQLSGSSSLGGQQRVEHLLVKQGDRVRSGQVVAILDSRDRLQAALEQAKEQMRVNQTRLAQVVAGAKTGDIDAQAATVSRLRAELSNAQIEYQRYQSLYREGAISASSLDSRRLVVETTQAQLQQAQRTLTSIAEVRPVDVDAVRAELNSTVAAVKHAQAELDLAYVRSPRDGQIIRINTWSGEIIGEEGIVSLGQTEQMYVVAEIYESNISQVRLGQSATVTGSAFVGELRGTVEQIGLDIRKRDVLDTDPTADIDARVVEVKIRLEPPSSQKVAGLINLEVTVKIPN